SEHSIDTERFTAQTSTDDQRKRPEKQIDSKHLTLWIASADRWRQQQAAADVGRCNAEDRQLHVPGPQQIAWKKIRDVDSIKALGVGSIMGGSSPDKCLRQEQ